MFYSQFFMVFLPILDTTTYVFICICNTSFISVQRDVNGVLIKRFLLLYCDGSISRCMHELYIYLFRLRMNRL